MREMNTDRRHGMRHHSASIVARFLLGACAAAQADTPATPAQPPPAQQSPAPKATVADTTAASPAERLPVADFGRLPFVEHAELAPDGKHWAGLLAIDGTQIIAMLSVFDKTERIVRTALPDGMQVRWLRWVNSDNLLVAVDMLQAVEREDWYISRVVALNRVSGKMTVLLSDLAGQNASDVLWWPNDDSNEVLIAGQNSVFEGEDWWPAVYRVDVTKGFGRSVVSPHPGIAGWGADSDGSVRVGVGYDDSRQTLRLVYRPAGSHASFRTVDRADARKREGLQVPFMFLPGGDHALVIHDDERGMSGIYEVDLATQSEVRTVYTAPAGEVEGAVVSADGATLLGAYDSSLHGGMHWFDADMAALQAALDKAVPGARVAIESMTRDRTAMLVRLGAADMPGALYYFNVNEGRLRRLAVINERFGPTRRLAPVKVVSYKARDGLEIEGVLTLPVGRDPRKLPFIVMPHGGPWAQDRLEYDYWVQFLANRGYGVLQPNFRGSTGYGAEFLKKGEGQLGLAMQDDVTDAVRWAVGQGLADASRVCIVGASYGGYAAMWGIVRDPDQYRCAISIAGVSSLSREVNDFANDMYERKYRDDWKRMAPDFDAVSPLKAVERIKTPLLLIHGKKDITVAHVQSVKMYDRMRSAGKTVEFVSLPLADHYYTRQDDRIALLTAMDNFLAKYNPAD
jgi:dipeptidyl aminopeptidase/acylaminoacyl peptidase